MTASLLLSGLFISSLGMILIFYAKYVGRFLPAFVGVAMCIYPFFLYNVLELWGITAALCVLVYWRREK